MATERMCTHRIGALVVLNDQGDVVGLVSERDVVESLARFGAGVPTGLVGESMTRNVITCSPDDRVNDLMAVMTRHRVRHLCVMENGQLAGMISIGDLVKSRLNELELESNVTRTFASADKNGCMKAIVRHQYIARLQGGLRKPKHTTMGTDVAGTVEAVGTKVTRVQPGDEVFCGAPGSLAEYATACPTTRSPRSPPVD